MSVTYFVPNTVYTVAGTPSVRLMCTKVSRTFTQFRVLSCSAQNSALQVGQVIRRKNFGSASGPMVWPLMREAGQPTLVGAPSVPSFWANLCPAAGALSVSNLANAMNSATVERLVEGTNWSFDPTYDPGYMLIGLNNNTGFTFGQATLTTCIINNTGAPVTPKISSSPNYHAVNISGGTFSVYWNEMLIQTFTSTYQSMFTPPVSAPAAIPVGVSTKSVIRIVAENLNPFPGSLAGFIELGITL